MKKITLVLFTFLAFQLGNAQLPQDFNAGNIPTGWTTFIGTNGEGTTANWENAGTYMSVAYEAVATSSQDWLVSPLVPITTTTSLLIFDQTDAFAPNYGSTYTVRISTASQTTHADFTVADTQNELSVTNGTPLVFSGYSVDLSAYEGQSVYIAFVLEQNDGDYWFIDNVNLANQYVTAPGAVTTPTPANGAINVPIDISASPTLTITPFEWVASATGDAATSFVFNLGVTPAGDDIGSLPGFDSGGGVNYGWQYSTLYYWSVDAINAGGSTPSAVWSFTTEADPNLSIDDNNDVIFSVYPNPFKDKIKIITQSTIDHVEVFNQLGQSILKIKADSLLENTINLSTLNSGIYFIKVNADGKTQTVKILKN